MKQVKIISGVYGYKPQGAKFIEPVHAGALCIVTDEEAVRLEKLRIGVCVGDAAAESVIPPVATPAGGDDDSDAGENPPAGQGGAESEDGGTLDIVNGHFTAESLTLMTKANLNKLAKDLGTDVSKCKNKAEMVAILTAIEVSADEDGEEPPAIGAEDPVT